MLEALKSASIHEHKLFIQCDENTPAKAPYFFRPLMRTLVCCCLNDTELKRRKKNPFCLESSKHAKRRFAMRFPYTFPLQNAHGMQASINQGTFGFRLSVRLIIHLLPLVLKRTHCTGSRDTRPLALQESGCCPSCAGPTSCCQNG